MNRFDELPLPQALPFCQTPLQQVHKEFREALDTAVQDSEKARQMLYNMPSVNPGLNACADFQLFLVRFEVANNSLERAYEVLKAAFDIQAQPLILLRNAETWLDGLAAQQSMEILPSLEHYRVFLSVPELNKRRAPHAEFEVDTDLWERFKAEAEDQGARKRDNDQLSMRDPVGVLGELSIEM